MNRLLLVTLISAVLMASSGYAQQRGKTDDGLPPVQPPPSMDDPGNVPAPLAAPPSAAPVRADPNVKTIPLANSDAEAKAAADDARKISATPVPLNPPEPEKKFDSPGLPPDVQKAAEASELPVVTVRQEGNETIEEYRKHGKLFMQRVQSKDGGPTKWYVDKRYDGPLPPDVSAGGVSGRTQPVEYKILGWN
jgi:hypothetical protein